MALSNAIFTEVGGGVCEAKGFSVATAHAGIRKSEKDDLMLLLSNVPAVCAGVLTTNQVKAWCVRHNTQRLVAGKADAIFCSAGNANACNGEAGKIADQLIGQEIKSFFF